MTNIQPFDMKSVQDRVSESIKGQFAALIPEETWKALVETQTRAFIQDELPRMIKFELEKEFRAALLAELAAPEFQSTYFKGSEKPGEALVAITEQLMPDLMNAFFGGMVNNALNLFKGQLQNAAQQGTFPRF